MNIQFVQDSLPLTATWWLVLWGKSVAIFLLVFGVSHLARLASASTRHAIWLSGFIALALLAGSSWYGGKTARVEIQTVREVVLPNDPTPENRSLTNAFIPKENSISVPAMTPASSTQPPSPPPPSRSLPWFSIGWLMITGTLLSRLAISQALARRRLLADTIPADSGPLASFTTAQGLWRSVTFLEHPHLATPLTYGTLRPKILLPAEFRTWAPERQTATLVHEFAHIRRCDTLSLGFARVLACLFWPNPLLRRALRQMRHLQEEAADNAVLLHGSEHESYADFLLDIAKSRHPVDSRLSAGLAMATPKLLPERIAAILDRSRNRDRTSRNAIFHLYGIATLARIFHKKNRAVVKCR